MLGTSWIGEGAFVGNSECAEASGLDEVMEFVLLRRLLP